MEKQLWRRGVGPQPFRDHFSPQRAAQLCLAYLVMRGRRPTRLFELFHSNGPDFWCVCCVQRSYSTECRFVELTELLAASSPPSSRNPSQDKWCYPAPAEPGWSDHFRVSFSGAGMVTRETWGCVHLSGVCVLEVVADARLPGTPHAIIPWLAPGGATGACSFPL